MKKSILPSSNIKYNFSSHFKNKLWIIPVKWMKASYCMWCCPLNSEGAWWGMLHQGPRMLSQPKRKHKHTPGPDNCQWNKLISAPLLKKEKKIARVWGYEGKSPSPQQQPGAGHSASEYPEGGREMTNFRACFCPTTLLGVCCEVC